MRNFLLAFIVILTWTTNAMALTCSAGYRVNSSGKSCELCPQGQYQDTSNTTKSCKECPSYSASNYHVYGGNGEYAKPWSRSTDSDSAGIPDSVSKCFIYFTAFYDSGRSEAWIYSPNTHHGHFSHYSSGTTYNGVCFWDPSKSSYTGCEGPKNEMSGCMPGYYMNSSASAGAYFTNACTICPAGTYQGYTHSMAVGNAGTMYYHDSTSCTKCAAGTSSSATGATSSSTCTKCNGRDNYSTEGSAQCTPVSTGYYTTGCSSVANAELGTVYYSNCTGQKKCEAGNYCVDGVKTACPSGYTSSAGASAQTSCYVSVSAGHYKTSATGSATTTCSVGMYKAAHNSYYNSSDGCTTCTNKPANSYYTSYGTSSSCPWACNSAVKGTGAYSATVTKGTNSCTYSGTCSANYHSPTASGTTINCTACDPGYHTSAGNTATSCTPNTYTVAYNLNDGTGTTPASTSCTYGTDCALNNGTATTFYRAGYRITGWRTGASSGTTYALGANVKTLTTTNGGTVTLYAVWTACGAGTHHSDATGTAANSCPNCTTGTYSTGTAIECTACTNKPTNSYYTSYGTSNACSWACNSAVKGTGAYSATVTKGTNSCTYSGTCNANYHSPTASGTTINCTACSVGYHTSANNTATSCDANTYTVAYDLNGGTGTAPASKSCTYGVNCTLNNGTATTFYKPGRRILYWRKGSPTGTVYLLGQNVTNLTTDNGGTVTMYAYWTTCSAGTYHSDATGIAANKCPYCETGTYAAGTGNTECTTCTNKPENSTYSGYGTTSVCPWACDTGYSQTYDNQCRQLCTIPNARYLRTDTGIRIPLYNTKYTSPSLVIGIGENRCYGNLLPNNNNDNVSGAINAMFDDKKYHIVN